MTEFERILQGTCNTRAILIYGRMDELFVPETLVRYPFYPYLVCMLKANGFQNVVFFDASKTRGKWTLDAESARYAFTQNQTPAQVQPEVHFRETPPAPPPAEAPFVRQQRYLEENVFFDELYELLHNRAYRSAVIITNWMDTIYHADLNFMRRLASLLNDDLESSWNNPANLLIFLEPDLHDDCSADVLVHALAQTSLRDRFMLQKDRDTWVLDAKRTFHIGQPDVDELSHLLRKYALPEVGRKSLRLQGNLQRMAEALLFQLRDGYARERRAGMPVRPATLRDVDARIYEALCAGGAGSLCVDVDSIGRFSPFRTEQAVDPAERLKQTKGWEAVSVPIFSAIARTKKLYAISDPAAAQRPSAPLVVQRLSRAEHPHCPDAAKLPHVMLKGEPGVGKSEIARLVGQIFKREGLLRIGHTVEARASDIIADHVGGTAQQVSRLLQQAEGGVLFIDEAYALYATKQEVSFKFEAIDALVQALTDPTRHFLLILAGYPNTSPEAKDGVEALYEMNKGLRSRIKLEVEIQPYSAALLAEIAVQQLKQHSCRLGETVHAFGLRKLWEQKLRTRHRRDWSNAREVVTYMRSVIANCRMRDSDTVEDVDFPAEDRPLLLGKERTYDDILAEIAKQYPGLGEIAQQIAERAIRRERSARNRAAKQGKPYQEGRIAGHLILCGRPGTGKTTLGKELARLFGSCKLMSGADAVYCADARSVTAQQLKEMIRTAREMHTVLILDEAYGLSEENAALLLSPMSEYHDLLVIFNVYPHELEAFQHKNIGLASRCDVYHIADYPPEALGEIFRRFAQRDGFDIAQAAMEELMVLFRHWYAIREANPLYGNARDVEKLFAQMCDACDPDGPYVLTQAHIPAAEREIIRINRRSSKLEHVLAALNAYVGLEAIRTEITTLHKAQRIDQFHHIAAQSARVQHYQFVGPPGSGKTTAAKLLANALYAMNEIKTPHLLSISARDLIAGYVGQTASKTRETLEKGRNGVIFIDEAYMLASSGFGSANDSFRDEANAQLLLFLEEELGKTVVIFAGYEQEMRRFIASNPGYDSRIGRKIVFRPYTPEECLEILRRSLAQTPYQLHMTPQAEAAALETIAALACRDDFANARTMRNLCGRIQGQYVNRLDALLQAHPDLTFEAAQAGTVLPEDIPQP